jgi:hypothetical protein
MPSATEVWGLFSWLSREFLPCMVDIVQESNIVSCLEIHVSQFLPMHDDTFENKTKA